MRILLRAREIGLQFFRQRIRLAEHRHQQALHKREKRRQRAIGKAQTPARRVIRPFQNMGDVAAAVSMSLNALIHDRRIARFRIELAEQRHQRRREIKIAHAREQPHLRARHRIDGAQRRRRERVFQIFADDLGFDQHFAVVIQRGHFAQRIDREIFRRFQTAAGRRHVLQLQALGIRQNPHARGIGRQIGLIHFKRHNIPLMKCERGRLKAAPAFIPQPRGSAGSSICRIRGARWCGCGLRPGRRRGAACAGPHTLRARPGSVVTPAPPQAWIASSMTFSAMRGAATLIIAISVRATLLPTLSIMSAALSAEQTAHVDVDARFGDALLPHRMLGDLLAERLAREQALAHQFERAFGDADRAHAVMDAARPEAALRDLEAAAFAEQHVLDRHLHILEQDLAVAVRRVVIAEHRQHALDLHAGRIAWARGSAIAGGICRVSGSVLPITIMILQRGSPTPDDHHLRPLMT